MIYNNAMCFERKDVHIDFVFGGVFKNDFQPFPHILRNRQIAVLALDEIKKILRNKHLWCSFLKACKMFEPFKVNFCREEVDNFFTPLRSFTGCRIPSLVQFAQLRQSLVSLSNLLNKFFEIINRRTVGLLQIGFFSNLREGRNIFLILLGCLNSVGKLASAPKVYCN